MKKKLKAQELYLQSMITARQIGIVSRFTAYLIYRCDMLAKEQERGENGRVYKHKDLIKI